MEGEKTVAGLYWMGEESIFQLKKEKKILNCHTWSFLLSHGSLVQPNDLLFSFFSLLTTYQQIRS